MSRTAELLKKKKKKKKKKKEKKGKGNWVALRIYSNLPA